MREAVVITKEELERECAVNPTPTLEEIGLLLGVSKQYVYILVKRYGIKKARQGVNETERKRRARGRKELTTCSQCGGYKTDSSVVCRTCDSKNKRRITPQEEEDIRAIAGLGESTQKELAKIYKVSQCTISRIINGRASDKYRDPRMRGKK